jgi:predicted site-specific integrase-resolvase
MSGVVKNVRETDKMKINTLEAAQLLGINPTTLRLLMRKGKIKAPPIIFDSETNSTGRMWSEEDIEQARKVLESTKN